METHNSSESINKRSLCYGMCGGRSRIFCGIFLIVIGLFWLGKETHWFSPEILTLFWPFVFVMAGTWFITAALIKKRHYH
jgi:hypothetical protein